MSRVIKFRAWDERDSEMISWKKISEWDQDGINSFLDMLTDERHAVMQFTGLHDKNGKGIYEGDILRTHSGDYVVTWEKYQFVLPGYYYGAQDTPYDYFSEQGKDEVIGNIYEHPHLLPKAIESDE